MFFQNLQNKNQVRRKISVHDIPFSQVNVWGKRSGLRLD